MSEHELDPLRHLDRPHDLDAEADEHIRSAMFDAFDQATEERAQHLERPDSMDGEVELTSHSSTRASGVAADLDAERIARGQRSRRLVRLAAVAAVMLGVAGVVLVGSFDRDASAPADDPEVAEAVATYCSSVFNPLVDDVAAVRNTSTELIDRALRNLELMAQGWAEVGAELDGPEATTISTDADELLQAAADVRRAMTVLTAIEDVATGVDALASSVVVAVESAPGSATCRTNEIGR